MIICGDFVLLLSYANWDMSLRPIHAVFGNNDGDSLTDQTASQWPDRVHLYEVLIQNWRTKFALIIT